MTQANTNTDPPVPADAFIWHLGCSRTYCDWFEIANGAVYCDSCCKTISADKRAVIETKYRYAMATR